MREIEIQVKTCKRDIDFISKLVEGYDGIGTVRTLDATLGEIKILTFDHFQATIEAMLGEISNQGVEIHRIEIMEWNGVL